MATGKNTAIHGIIGRKHRRLVALIKLRLHRFHHHDGIVDHGADGKHKRKQGEQVDGKAYHGHHGERADDGNEDGYGRNKR